VQSKFFGDQVPRLLAEIRFGGAPTGPGAPTLGIVRFDFNRYRAARAVSDHYFSYRL